MKTTPTQEGWTCRFTVPAVPVAQPRPRAVTGGDGKARMANSDSRHAIHSFKATCRHAAMQAYSGPPLDCPLRMSLVFVMPRPDRLRWKSRPMPREPYCAKNKDWDNLGKAVSDALNELIYTDDGLLAFVTVEKCYAAGDEQPHVEVTIEPLEAE